MLLPPLSSNLLYYHFRSIYSPPSLVLTSVILFFSLFFFLGGTFSHSLYNIRIENLNEEINDRIFVHIFTIFFCLMYEVIWVFQRNYNMFSDFHFSPNVGTYEEKAVCVCG